MLTVGPRLRGNDNCFHGNDIKAGAKNATANSAMTAMKMYRDQTEGMPRIDALNGPMLPGQWLFTFQRALKEVRRVPVGELMSFIVYSYVISK